MRELLSRGTNGDSAYNSIRERAQGQSGWARSQPTVSSAKLLVNWSCCLATAAVSLALGFSLSGWPFGGVWVVLGLAAVAALAERGRVRLSRTLEESISLVPTLFAAVLFGPLASMTVAAASLIVDLRRPYLKWATYTCSRSITGALTGLAAMEARSLSDNRFTSIAAATIIASVVAQGLDLIFLLATARIRKNGVGETLKTVGPLVLAAVPLYTPLVALLVFAYVEVSPWILFLFFGPALAAQRLFGMYKDQRRLAEDLVVVNIRLERANISFATALVTTLDARDRYTAGHSAAVAIYARDIAERLELGSEVQQLAHLCGLVHDIGKIGLPAGLLDKPGPLTLEERRQMEKHSEIGERILAKVEDYSEIANIVRHHHERWDGEGYPDGLAGEQIPLLSRIIAVADAYNAMTSDRPYRDAMPSRVARMRLAQGVESQFDTHVVAAFEAILAGAPESYRMAASVNFTLEVQDYQASAPRISMAEVA